MAVGGTGVSLGGSGVFVGRGVSVGTGVAVAVGGNGVTVGDEVSVGDGGSLGMAVAVASGIQVAVGISVDVAVTATTAGASVGWAAPQAARSMAPAIAATSIRMQTVHLPRALTCPSLRIRHLPDLHRLRQAIEGSLGSTLEDITHEYTIDPAKGQSDPFPTRCPWARASDWLETACLVQ